MVWPTDDLTKTHLDAGTDSPSSARAEILALIDKVKLILAEVDAGATIWHSRNDGATSGLDADLLDGQSSSYYRDASNINAGAIPLAHIPAALTGKDADTLDGQHGSFYRNANNLNDGIVPLARLSGITGSQIAASTVAAGNLKTNTQEVSISRTSPGVATNTVVSTSTDYNFSPTVKVNSAGNINLIKAYAGEASGFPSSFTGYLTVYIDNGTSGVEKIVTAQARYVDSSPPHKINGVDYDDFVFLLLGKHGEVKGTCIDKNPPWFFNGPTNCRYTKIVNGRKYRTEREISNDVKALKITDIKSYLKEIRNAKLVDVEITEEIKNADMNIIPHPFVNPDGKVIIVEPSQSGVYYDLCLARCHGETVPEIIANYCKVDNTEIPTSGKPPGVAMHRIKWRNSK